MTEKERAVAKAKTRKVEVREKLKARKGPTRDLARRKRRANRQRRRRTSAQSAGARHAVQDCWFNSKGAGKGKQQQGQKGAKGGVHAVADETASTALSAGPSVSGGPASFSFGDQLQNQCDACG